MIIQKPASTGDVVSFRITSGEEIVGKWASTTNDTITIDRPITIVLQMHNGQPGLSFMPFMLSIDDSGKLIFYKSSMVTTPTPTRPDIASKYMSATTGLVQPEPGAGGLIG